MVARRLVFRCQPEKRAMVAHNLELVLGNQLSPAAAQEATRDWFRLSSAPVGGRGEAVAGPGSAPAAARRDPRREHLEDALARAREPSSAAATSAPTRAASRCCTPAGSRSPVSGAPTTTMRSASTKAASHPPSGGSASARTPHLCASTGSGRTSSHGLAGSRSRRWQLPHFAR
jgi:hypothetical protein